MDVWLQCKHSAKFYVVFCRDFGGTKHICAAEEISRCDPGLLSYLKLLYLNKVKILTPRFREMVTLDYFVNSVEV